MTANEQRAMDLLAQARSLIEHDDEQNWDTSDVIQSIDNAVTAIEWLDERGEGA